MHTRNLSIRPSFAGIDDYQEIVDLVRSVIALLQQANQAFGVPVLQKE